MAVIIQPSQKGSRTFILVSIAAVIAMVAVGAYYLFFTPAPLIEAILPANLQSVADLKGLKFNPEEVLQNDFFSAEKSRKSIILPEAGASVLGRTNPFAAF
ncbi:MAG: hypothetical protein M1586_02110 [Patescibacteria group bacterium]|nr:hypothetical protein [Patescibacteria group bacterium]MCL5262075.1 hypothetical protein [Patescibacteria group bacterium]